MKKHTTYFFLFLFIGFLSFKSEFLFAQSEPGIVWEHPPSNSRLLSNQIALLEKLGIKEIELIHPVESELLDSLSNHSFEVLVRSEYTFLTTSTFKAQKKYITENYTSIISRYKPYDCVTGIGLFTFSQSYDRKFIEILEPILIQLKTFTHKNLYSVSSSHLPDVEGLDFTVRILDENDAKVWDSKYLLLPFSKFHRQQLPVFASVLESESSVFFSFQWLQEALYKYPTLEEALAEFQKTGDFILPLPKQTPHGHPANWDVILLVLLWLSLGLHMKWIPNYSVLITRFFTSHKFFVDDILHYRERNAISGGILFVQHALFTGLLFYVLSSVFISEKGLDLLYSRFPYVFIVGKTHASIFIWGSLFAILLEIIALLWLFIPSKSLTHFNQASNLYTWAFHLDFILMTLILVLKLSHISPVLLLILSIAFMLIWFTTFNMTAIDSSRYLIKDQNKYLIYTVGLHTLIFLAVFMAIFSINSVRDYLSLAFTL